MTTGYTLSRVDFNKQINKNYLRPPLQAKIGTIQLLENNRNKNRKRF